MRKILSEKLEVFLRTHASSKKTLDIGSRKGKHSAYFPNITTIDINPDHGPDIVADAHALPFPDASYEVVICSEVLEHVKDPAQVLRELRRVLVPGGLLLLSTRFLFPIHEAPDDRWRFTQYNLRELFVDWKDVELEADTKPMTTIGCLLERLVWQTDFVFPNKIIKGLLMLLARLFMLCDFMVIRQYGDVTKGVEVDTAFTTGFYITAKK